jgi:Family of unknown function (DUF6165)
MTTKGILTEISIAEFVDKITILRIKAERIQEREKLRNIHRELSILDRIRTESLGDRPELSELEAELKSVNEEIWELEDRIRDSELRKDFGDGFVSVARSIYRANDRRAVLKRQINDLMGSGIVEEKSYSPY